MYRSTVLHSKSGSNFKLTLICNFSIQERLRLSLIQELCRAQQRAKKGPAPLSACTLLLEKLLPLSTPTELRYLKLETEQK